MLLDVNRRYKQINSLRVRWDLKLLQVPIGFSEGKLYDKWTDPNLWERQWPTKSENLCDRSEELREKDR